MESRRQMTIMNLTMAALAILGMARAKIWDPAVDPLPPLQPQEMGCYRYEENEYYNLNTSQQVLYTSLPGYQFQSYAFQVTQIISGGVNQQTPVMQTSFSNFSVPVDEVGTTRSVWADQACYGTPIEGGQAYPGYDYYTKSIMDFYAMNYTIYYESVTAKDNSTLLVYTVQPGWPDPTHPRYINYTTTFQNTTADGVYTGYLLTYEIKGTEWCCSSNTGEYMGCPNDLSSGVCPGTDPPLAPYLTSAHSTVVYSDYTVYNSSSAWPTGFFGAYCPFDTTEGQGNSSDDDNSMDYEVATIALSVLCGLSLFANVYFAVALLGIGKDKAAPLSKL